MILPKNKPIVIGAGLAGVEAAWQLANRGIEVCLAEMKPQKFSPAHKSENFAELVCSNSLKALRIGSAAGMLKEEMKCLGSLTVERALLSAVPAGGALAVDRDKFSQLVTEKIKQNKYIEVVHGEVTQIPENDIVIIAAGPLVSENLAKEIEKLSGGFLSFFDAAAPIVSGDSIDMENAFCQSRYDRGDESDYINCPMNKEEYENFYSELVNAERAELHTFEKKKNVYEGCMPIEIMASRGADTMRFGPLKPVGLRDPRTGHRPWAVLQLRKENLPGSAYNLVGFQTNLKFGEQKRVFSLIPALRNAEFLRYGVMHRNTFINSPKLLKPTYEMRDREGLFFAGQITGVEGYIESASSGLVAGINMAKEIMREEKIDFPTCTALGGLSHYISNPAIDNFQPMNVTFGIIDSPQKRFRKKREKNAFISQNSLEKLQEILPSI